MMKSRVVSGLALEYDPFQDPSWIVRNAYRKAGSVEKLSEVIGITEQTAQGWIIMRKKPQKRYLTRMMHYLES